MAGLNKNRKEKGWFKTGNVFFDVHVKNIGYVSAIIYLFIKRYEYLKTRYCWPSEEFIAKHLAMSTRTVKRKIKKLAIYHFIVIEKIKEKGKWPNNLYYLTQSSDWLHSPCASQSHSKKYPQSDKKDKVCVPQSHTNNTNDKKRVLELIQKYKKNNDP